MIKSWVYGKVKTTLHEYPANKQRLDEARAEILHSTPRRTEGRQGGRKTDATAARGIQLADLNAQDWARWVDCITDVMEILAPEAAKLIRLRYFEQLPVEDVADKLHVSKAWYFVLHDQVLRDVILFATQRRIIVPVADKHSQ